MSLWIQHGYGKGDKLDRLASETGVDGVVLSPADESAQRLPETVNDCVGNGLDVAVDPQTYVYTIPQGAGRLHGDHGLDVGPLNWAISPANIESQIRSVVDLNARLATSITIGPAPLQRTFGDVWTPISLQYARAASDVTDGPLLATLAVSEGGFGSWNEVELWLDQATQLEVAGFYMIVSRGVREYPPVWAPEVLGNVMRLIYRLSAINQYQVVWGYSDLAGLLGTAVGARAVGAGWFYTLRSFAESKWQPSTGGSQAVPRVLARGLLSPLEVPSDAHQVARSELALEAMGEERTRSHIASDPESWGQTHSWDQHLRALAHLVEEVEEAGAGTGDGLDFVTERLSEALRLFDALTREGVPLDTVHRTSIVTYLRALGAFRDAEGI